MAADDDDEITTDETGRSRAEELDEDDDGDLEDELDEDELVDEDDAFAELEDDDEVVVTRTTRRRTTTRPTRTPTTRTKWRRRGGRRRGGGRRRRPAHARRRRGRPRPDPQGPPGRGRGGRRGRGRGASPTTAASPATGCSPSGPTSSSARTASCSCGHRSGLPGRATTPARSSADPTLMRWPSDDDPIRAEVERRAHAIVGLSVLAPALIVGSCPAAPCARRRPSVTTSVVRSRNVVRTLIDLVARGPAAEPGSDACPAPPTWPRARAARSRARDRPSWPIDEYESLAASQVVARLPTLTADELAAVRRSRPLIVAGARSSAGSTSCSPP